MKGVYKLFIITFLETKHKFNINEWHALLTVRSFKSRVMLCGARCSGVR